jgi:hypothetical protein
LHIEPMPRLRSWLARAGQPEPSLQVGWEDIRALDPSLCDRMQAMARSHGYEP